jgi:hypothetical protein
MSDRRKGEALARKFRAPKTAEVIATACYERIFASAIEEIGTATLVEALVEASDMSIGIQIRPTIGAR